MTKAELIDALSEFKDNDTVVIEIHDTVAEGSYDFYVDAVYLNPLHNNHESEIELTLINHWDL